MNRTPTGTPAVCVAWDFPQTPFSYWQWCVEDTIDVDRSYDLGGSFVSGSLDLGLAQNDGAGGMTFTLGPVPGPDEAPSGIISADWFWQPSPGSPVPDGFPRYVLTLDPSGEGCSGDYCIQWPWSYSVYTSSGTGFTLDPYESDVFVGPSMGVNFPNTGGVLHTDSGHFTVPVPHGHIYDFNVLVRLKAIGEGNTSTLNIGKPVIKCTQCMTAFTSGGFSDVTSTFTLPPFTAADWEVVSRCGVNVSFDGDSFTATAATSSGEAHAAIKLKDASSLLIPSCENILTGFNLSTTATDGTGSVEVRPGFKVVDGSRAGQYGFTGVIGTTYSASVFPMNASDVFTGNPDFNSFFGPHLTHVCPFFAINFVDATASSGPRVATVSNPVCQAVQAVNT